MMKRLFMGLATGLIVVLSGQSFAQSVRIEIEPQQRTRIKEYVVKERVPRTTVRERVRVGGTVPREIELREVPEDWGPSLRRYRYYHTESGVHFVDPESRHVIYDLD